MHTHINTHTRTPHVCITRVATLLSIRSLDSTKNTHERVHRERVPSVTSYCGLLSTCGESVAAFLADPRSLADRQRAPREHATEASEDVEGAFEVRLGRY